MSAIDERPGRNQVVKIKGSVLRSRLAMVDEMAPDGGRERVLARLEPRDRETLGALLAASWYPFELGSRLDGAIVDELGGGRRPSSQSSARPRRRRTSGRTASTASSWSRESPTPSSRRRLSSTPSTTTRATASTRRSETARPSSRPTGRRRSAPRTARRWWAGTAGLSRCAGSRAPASSRRSAVPAVERSVDTA
jgi:hypothetical protein